MDGWSLPILLQEIFASYCGQQLPAATPYRRFVTWLADRDVDAARAAWCKALAGFDTPTLVGSPARLKPGPRDTTAFQVSEQTTRALNELARSNHTTVNTVLQGVWAQTLMWLTGQHDVAFGTAVSGRPAEVAGAEAMVGLLINTVPVRAHITPATTAADLLDQLHCAHNHTLDHQHLALNEIHRATGHDQLFDTLFVYENYPIDTSALLSANGLTITEFTGREANHYPLTMQATPGTELGFRIEYDTDVFDTESVDTLTRRLQRVLLAMNADPQARLSTIDVLDAGEHTGLDEMGNRAVLTRPASAPVSIPVLFADHVARSPQAVAISSVGRSLTYRDLDEASNQLAHLISGYGASPGGCVALLVERSAEAVIAMLAVLKTGAAYLAIDPALPDERIRFMVSDAAPVAAVTTTRLRSRLAGCDLAVIDIADPRIATQACTALPAPAADDIAYLIYTSGTTGVPKGVAITHHNVAHLVESSSAHLPAAQVWTQCHSYAFDFSVWEIWAALARRRAPGRGARTRGELTERLPRPAHRRTRHRAHPNPLRGRGALPARLGVGGAAPRRRVLSSRAGGPVGTGAGRDQRLRPYRNHRLRHHERPIDHGFGSSADRCAGVDRGIVRPRRLAAPGTPPEWSANFTWRAAESASVIPAGRADRVAIRSQPVRGPGGADVSHGRPGALGRRRATALPGPRRRTGENPRLPHRTRRNPGRPGRTGRR